MEITLFKNTEDFKQQYLTACTGLLGKDFEDCSAQERYFALARLVALRAQKAFVESRKPGEKKIYYFSLEFLLGPLLDNYLLNLGATDMVKEALSELGANYDEIIAQEQDPGLGNGGLGRLAACFLDSLAHLGVAGFGNGMRYQYGLFKQVIKDGRQVEVSDSWLEHGFPWETRKEASAVTVQFGGEVIRHQDDKGNYWFTQEGGQFVKAVPYDVAIIGYGPEHYTNKLRLWSAEPVQDDFDLDAFNAGDYARAAKYKADVEAISTILYPNDSGEHGRILRLKQEYLFVSAGLQTILRSYEHEYGPKWEDLPKHVGIHTNDTHPAMAGPELMRILVDEKRVDFDTAFEIATHCISYTNHTVLPEALEKWPIDTFRNLLPRLYMFIEEVDRRYRENFSHEGENWSDKLKATAILWDGQVRMANLSIMFAHSVNGVSDLHTNILKERVLKDFYDLRPEIFNNKTNGVCHRRFLANANVPYAKLISSKIGDGWLDDADELAKLEPYAEDGSFQAAMREARAVDKRALAAYIKEQTGVELDPESIFDVQVKRFHAYKRQLLNIMKVMNLYNRMKADPNFKPPKTSFIFAGKAAQSYTLAKEVIRLINSVAHVINNDPDVNDYIKVAFVPNFGVKNAQLIYAAADISEQISTAGQEASGTSNMKLMMNGALTLGTYDGSNIEISQLVGDENIKIFGLREQQVEDLKNSGHYYAWDVYNGDKDGLGRCIDQLVDGTYAELSGNFEMIHEYLMVSNDPDLVLADFADYVKSWEELAGRYQDQQSWWKSAILNTARSGYFSADRTIKEYLRDIWHA